MIRVLIILILQLAFVYTIQCQNTHFIYNQDTTYLSSNAISVLSNERDKLILKPGYTWFSLPKLPVSGNSGAPVYTIIHNRENYVPSFFNIRHNMEIKLFNSGIGSGALSEFFSINGYKINNQSISTGIIFVDGTIADPKTEIPLVDTHENWIGYFLTKPQPIEEAFGEIWEKVKMVKMQHWSIVRPYPNGAAVTTSGIQGGVLQYGDMIAVTMLEPATLIWNNEGKSIPVPQVDKPKVFSYMEKENYTPVAVILDPADSPEEIAVYCNNICLGSSVVYGDTVMIQAYFNHHTKGDDKLEIVRYYNQNKHFKNSSEYYVLNQRTGLMEKRFAHIKDGQPFYILCLNKQVINHQINNKETNIKIFLDSEEGDINIEGFANEGNTISCTLSRPDGSFCKEIYKSDISSGTFRTTIHPDVAPGLYLITLTDGTYTKTEKIVIMY